MNKKSTLWLLALSICMFFFLANWNIGGPIVQGDEGGYLANAAAFAGYRFDGASSYHAGYSLLIAPAIFLSHEPHTIFTIVRLINSLMWGISTLLLYAILKYFFADAGHWKLFGATMITMLYPSWITMSGYAFSESGFVLFYTLSIYLALRVVHHGRAYWLLWALSLGYLYAIHPRSISILAAAFMVSFLIAKTRREWNWLFGFVLIVVSMVLLYNKVFEPWLIMALTTGKFPPELHYPANLSFLSSWDTTVDLPKFFVVLAAHLMYIIVATLGMAVISLISIAGNFWLHRSGKSVLSFFKGNNLVFIFMGLALTVTLMASVFQMTLVAKDGPMQYDFWMYGRYTEAVILPLLAISFLQAVNKKIILTLTVFTGVCSWIMLVGIEKHTPAAPYGIIGFWQAFYLKDGSPVLWWLAGILPLIFFLLADTKLRFLIAGSLFIFSSVLQLNYHKEEYYGFGGNHHDLATYIRETKDRGTCVGLDNIITPGPWSYGPILQYKFYLYDYDYKRMDIYTWHKECNGPLISFSNLLGDTFKDVIPVAIERARGPLLWVKASAADVDTFYEGFYYKKIVISPESLETRMLLRGGWNTPETGHVWSTDRAEIMLPVSGACNSKIRCGLRIIFGVFNASKSSPKTVLLTLNGSQAAEWTVSSSGRQEFFIPFAANLLTGSNRRVSVVVSVPKAESPVSLGYSIDNRILGLDLQEMEAIGADEFYANRYYNKIKISPDSLEARALLGVGWYDIEKEWVWSKERAEINLPILSTCHSKGDCILRMAFGVFNASQASPKIVLVEVNGVEAAKWVVNTSEAQEYALPLSTDMLEAGGTQANVVIRIPGAESPMMTGVSTDDRILGVGLRELELIQGK